MSAPLVLDELGSDVSSVVESIHVEAHGEFGVTCSARLNGLSRQRRNTLREKRDAMMQFGEV